MIVRTTKKKKKRNKTMTQGFTLVHSENVEASQTTAVGFIR